MNASELRRSTDTFLLDTVAQLRSKPFAALHALPEYPESTKIDLGVPADLLNHKCAFSLMKDTLPDGAVRIAIQYHRPGIIKRPRTHRQARPGRCRVAGPAGLACR